MPDHVTEDWSQAEETVNSQSEGVAAADSWGDTDEESDMEPHKKKVNIYIPLLYTLITPFSNIQNTELTFKYTPRNK